VARLRRALIAAVVAQGLLGVGALSIAPEPAPGPAPLTLRVVTFNLLHGGIFSELSGDDEHLEERLRLAVRELRALDADVVGLQEASTGRHRGNVAARLADALGYHHVQAPAATRPFGSEHMRRAVASMLGFSEGPALLSRFPIVRWGARELPRCGRPFDVRVLIFAELETSVGRVVAFSTHLSGSECHARALAELVRATAGPLPALVMGDFNATDTAQAIRFLTRSAGFVDAFRLANPATPGFTAGQDVAVSRPTATQRIDYVFLVPGARARARVNGSRVVHGEPSEAGPARWASDHYPVLAEVALELQAPPTLADSRAGRAGGDQQDGGT
jgi:endonuclease/exonuclease/phosphatase family metal-dependent hydrolase